MPVTVFGAVEKRVIRHWRRKPKPRDAVNLSPVPDVSLGESAMAGRRRHEGTVKLSLTAILDGQDGVLSAVSTP